VTLGSRAAWRRWTLYLAGAIAVWLFGVWPPPLWWRTHWPRESAMMREQADPPLPDPPLHPTPLDQISPLLQRMVVIGEDSRFRTHHGIDFAELGDALGVDAHVGWWRTVRAAWAHRSQLRGASTIPQQLAKNLYLSPTRSALRKLKEAVTAVRLDAALSKNRIMELYLNTAEFGPGVWGADAASRAYFGVPASQLSEDQAAQLAATLPHPRTSNPLFRPARTLARRDLILARYHGVDVYVPPDTGEDSLLVPVIIVPIIPPALESLKVAVPPPESVRDTTRVDTTKAKHDSTKPDSSK
jgi:monofunctional biosynthetic peptidoglycan transglycosylase